MSVFPWKAHVRMSAVLPGVQQGARMGWSSALTRTAAPECTEPGWGAQGSSVGESSGWRGGQLKCKGVQATVGSVASYGCERFTLLEKCLKQRSWPWTTCFMFSSQVPSLWLRVQIFGTEGHPHPQFDSSIKLALDPDCNFSLRRLSEHRGWTT